MKVKIFRKISGTNHDVEKEINEFISGVDVIDIKCSTGCIPISISGQYFNTKEGKSIETYLVMYNNKNKGSELI